jgi:hypothetical protein
LQNYLGINALTGDNGDIPLVILNANINKTDSNKERRKGVKKKEFGNLP